MIIKKKIKENIIVYSKRIFELLSQKFENNISYRYKLLFLKNEQYNQYSVSLAIETDNLSNKNKIALYKYKDFMKLNREKQLEYMGDIYNAEIIGKKEEEFTIEEAEKDFFKLCDFNYLRNIDETKENEGV